MGRTSDARERIIQTSIELFHARSFDAVGVAEICKEAGVVKGSFYHFFESKDDLALAVIDTLAEGGRALFETYFAPQIPPLERFEGWFNHFYEEFRGMKAETGCIHGCPFGNLAAELSTRSEAIRNRLADVYEGLGTAFQTSLDEAVAQGDLPDTVDTQLAAQTLVVMMQGLSVIAKAYNDPEKVKDISRHAVALATGVAPQAMG